MHILQINNNHRVIGGSDRVYLDTGRLLEDRDHLVSYFASKSPDNEPCEDAQYFCDGLDTKTATARDWLKFLNNPKAGASLERLLCDKADIDLAHLHIYYGRLTPIILSKLRKHQIPIIQTLHEYKLVCPVYTMERRGQLCNKCLTGSTLNCIQYKCKANSFSKSALIWAEHHLSKARGAVDCVDKFICVSNFQRDIMVQGGIPPEKLATLYNVIDTAKLKPSNPQPRDNYLLYFGRIEELKGLDTLLEASRLTGVPLKIAGTGSWSSELRRRVEQMRNVEYLDFVSGERLKTLVASAKAVVVPSEWYESFGLTAAEAKAVGTPVIASRIGGLTEVIRDGIDGILFEPGNVEDLSRALYALGECDADAMGAEGQKDVQQRFSPEAHYSSLMQIYDQTLSKRR